MNYFRYTWEDQLSGVESVVDAILEHNLSPFDSEVLLIKTASSDNVEQLLMSLNEKVGSRYIDYLKNIVAGFDENADLSQDEECDYVRDGELIPEFRSGMTALKEYWGDNELSRIRNEFERARNSRSSG